MQLEENVAVIMQINSDEESNPLGQTDVIASKYEFMYE